MSEKQEETTVIRDLDAREDFDANGEVKNEEMKAHFDAEREKLLGAPVGSGKAADAIPSNAPEIQKAGKDEKPVFSDGDSADFLARRYSKDQLLTLAEEYNAVISGRQTIANLAIAVQKAAQEQVDSEKQTSATVLPAAPEINAPASDEADDDDDA